MLGGHRHVLTRGRKRDDVRPVVSEHGFVSRDVPQPEFRVGESR